VRGGARLFAEGAERPVGVVTSGGFGPSVQAPVAMGYVESGKATTGARLFADVRGKLVPVRICTLPFIPHTYKRH
jgi:aminomethyltransferase